MLDILAGLRDLDATAIIFRFLLATVCGAFIGVERSRKNHAAGLRTHIVVCIGATSVMLLNQYLITVFNPNSDPARLGAQVISGIGFLGAGTIMVTGHQRGQYVRGLTTAAGLWASACMGLMIGSGFYEAAVIMCLFLFVVIAMLDAVDDKYLKKARQLRLYLEYDPPKPFSVVLRTLRQEGWHMTYVERVSDNETVRGILLDVQCEKRRQPKEELFSTLRQTEGIHYVEDI